MVNKKIENKDIIENVVNAVFKEVINRRLIREIRIKTFIFFKIKCWNKSYIKDIYLEVSINFCLKRNI
jgi:hypothetical protein